MSSITKKGKGPIDKYLGRKAKGTEAAISSTEVNEESDGSRAKKRKIQKSPSKSPNSLDKQRAEASNMVDRDTTTPKMIDDGTESATSTPAQTPSPTPTNESRYSIVVAGLREMAEIRTEPEGTVFMQRNKPHGVQFEGPRFTVRGEAIIWAKDPYSYNKILKGDGWKERASELKFSPSTRIKTEGPAVVLSGVPIKRWATPEEMTAPLAKGTTTFNALAEAFEEQCGVKLVDAIILDKDWKEEKPERREAESQEEYESRLEMWERSREARAARRFMIKACVGSADDRARLHAKERIFVHSYSIKITKFIDPSVSCKRCYAYDHTVKDCRTARENLRCNRCSQTGHFAIDRMNGDCTRQPHCEDCEKAGKPANHRLAGRECPVYLTNKREAIKRGTASAPPQTNAEDRRTLGIEQMENNSREGEKNGNRERSWSDVVRKQTNERDAKESDSNPATHCCPTEVKKVLQDSMKSFLADLEDKLDRKITEIARETKKDMEQRSRTQFEEMAMRLVNCLEIRLNGFEKKMERKIEKALEGGDVQEETSSEEEFMSGTEGRNEKTWGSQVETSEKEEDDGSELEIGGEEARSGGGGDEERAREADEEEGESTAGEAGETGRRRGRSLRGKKGTRTPKEFKNIKSFWQLYSKGTTPMTEEENAKPQRKRHKDKDGK